MKELIRNDPIVPFTDRVRQLYREANISTVLIIGGSGEYLDIADKVYFMENYRIQNLCEEIEKTRIHPLNADRTHCLSVYAACRKMASIFIKT